MDKVAARATVSLDGIIAGRTVTPNSRAQLVSRLE
jgi:hypothetical protein